jgi:F-type H+-transporting ATPase subunit delta
MITGKISARYAKALYKFAEERKQEESIYNEMKIVANSFFEVPELKEALANPTLTAQKKKDLLITAAGTQVCAEFKRFVDLVVEHKREEYFQSISLVYQDLYRKEKNIVISKIISANPISEAEELRFKEAVKSVTDGTIELEKCVDPDLIGGFILNVETYQLDASIKSQLRMVKSKLQQSNAKDV